jgi:hypothetical protein
MSAEIPPIRPIFSPSHFATTEYLQPSDAERTGIEGLIEGDHSVHEGAVAYGGLIHFASCNVLEYTHRTPSGNTIGMVRKVVACVDFGSVGTVDNVSGTFVWNNEESTDTGPVIGADISCEPDIRQADQIPNSARAAAFDEIAAKYRARLAQGHPAEIEGS